MGTTTTPETSGERDADGAAAGSPPLVLVVEPIQDEAVAWLAERARVECVELVEAGPELLREAQGLVVRTYTQVDPALLGRMPALKVVARAGVALENIDVAACRGRGVEVVHAPTANTIAVVEFVLAEMLGALRPHSRLERALSSADWNNLRARESRHRELSEITLGIYGFGRIGSQLGRRAVALGARVIYHDLREIEPPARHGAEPVDAARLLRESDVLSVHVDDRAGNRNLIDGEAMAHLNDDVVVINSSRGFVVDDAALAEFLRAHPHARAIIDVHQVEPPPADAPLLGVANARLTPHVAAGTVRAKLAMSWVVRDLWRVLAGEAPEHPAPQR